MAASPTDTPSALETSLVEWKRRGLRIIRLLRAALGNFLSGMETRHDDSVRVEGIHLGNFLSGMETVPSPPFAPSLGRPWKLP